MAEISAELASLANYLGGRRENILKTWRRGVRADPALTSSDSLPQQDLYDHIPALLATFDHELRRWRSASSRPAQDEVQTSAAAHGLQRWQQGYDLREVTRELGKLNECVVAELEAFASSTQAASNGAMSEARRLWASICSTGIEESVGQYFHLQQREAAGHVNDLERALNEVQLLEQRRADLWRQAAHDLRGNLGVVANASVGLTHTGLQEASRSEVVRILLRNVSSLHHLLEDVTSLARLQAGCEIRHVEPLDVANILQQLCEGMRPMAKERHLFLNCEGPAGFAADGDPVKIRRIAQNLVLNAIKFTREGGVTVSWGDSPSCDDTRWEMCIKDTGPGIQSRSAEPIAQALQLAHAQQPGQDDGIEPPAAAFASDPGEPLQAARMPAGEGIGLSIVKRLCELLDASLDMTSEAGRGTTFRILLPRRYPAA
jgi:signal transduction histidine kinase